MTSTTSRRDASMAKILIIDDEPSVRHALARILERDGHETIEAGNGVEARALVGEDVDLVLTDIFMPEMDGIEFVLWLGDAFPERPVVAMSGGGILPMRSALEDARELGAAAILEKPFDAERVRRIVEAALEGR